MSEQKNAPAVDEATENEVTTSAHLKDLVRELKQVREQNEGRLNEQREKSEKLFEEIRKEQAKIAEAVKTKQVPERSGPRITMKEVLAGKTDHPRTKEFQELNERAIYRQVLRGNVQLRKDATGEQVMVLPRNPEEWKGIPEYDEIRMKAAGDMWEGTTSGDGAEWVPTGIDSVGQDFYSIRGDLLGALQRRTIPRGVGALSIPVVTSEQGPDIVDEQTDTQTAFVHAATVGNGATAVATLTPKKHLQTLSVSVEGTEDMAVDSLAMMRRALAANLIGAIEESVINGQTASDATLDDAPAASGLVSADGYSAADGSNSFRLHATVNSHDTDSSGALTAAKILAARESMGKFGVRPGELALVTSPKGYLTLLQDSNVLTVDKLGSGATILSGQLASVAGIPVLVSDKFPEDIAATGIDAGTGATTGAVIFNRTQWTLGIAREMQMAMVPHVGYDIVNIVGSVRSHFVNHLNTSATCWYLYNVT